ncbi:MAG: LAGLIDADG family homing endonuclease [bacterium]|nr:LAGLIDADG family homing endonuclease [bacterium]
MAEKIISKRAIFPPGQQKAFLSHAQSKMGVSWLELSRILRVSNRSLTDWKREKFFMPLDAVKVLVRQAGLEKPKIKTREPFWYVSKGASLGWKVVYKKYGHLGGDPEYRKRRWREWWEREGKFKNHSIIGVRKSFHRPRQSEKLAEFFGIMMGDGGMTRYQAVITLHYKDDAEYIKFVVELIKRLFHISPSVYHWSHDKTKKSVKQIVVSRSGLVQHLHSLGLVIGNKVKQRFDAPFWIQKKKSFRIACVRGLFDTDGSVFIHRYQVGGKYYAYKKLAFTSASRPLANFFYNVLKEHGLHPRLARGGRDIWLDSEINVKKYFHLVSSHNSKHLKRYAK